MVKRTSVDAGLHDIEVKVKKVNMRGKSGGMFLSFPVSFRCIEWNGRMGAFSGA
jgi:hypothetical protein